MTTTAASMHRLLDDLERLEASAATVLIEGESGSGKELVARAIHEHSAFSAGPCVALNCGALDRALVRSELFGHRKGAFTGASDARGGAFEAAAGGTLFLDEIGELALEVQPALLRVLETSSVCRVGEHSERRIVVRVIAATNRNLADEVAAGRFREDLYFRLSVVRLRVPALRERAEDIGILAQQLARELGLGLLAGPVEQQLAERPWRGNVRELRNAIQSYGIFGALPEPSVRLNKPEPGLDMDSLIDPTQPYAEQKERFLRRFQSLYFHRLLAEVNGNKSQAARVAGVERSYLSKIVRGFSDPM